MSTTFVIVLPKPAAYLVLDGKYGIVQDNDHTCGHEITRDHHMLDDRYRGICCDGPLVVAYGTHDDLGSAGVRRSA